MHTELRTLSIAGVIIAIVAALYFVIRPKALPAGQLAEVAED